MGIKSSIRARWIIATALLLLLFRPALTIGTIDDRDAELLETGRAVKLQTPPPAPASIKIVSYNIRYRSGEDLRKLIELLKSDAEIGRAAIIGLQEVDRNRKRTGNVNTARLMAEELGMYYAWAAPPPPPSKGNRVQEEETGVAILSPYPLADVKRFVLPNEGPGGRRRAAIGATVKTGAGDVRVYSIHAELRTSNQERLQQLRAALDDLNEHHAGIERAVVLGDFNTLTGKDVDKTSELFTSAKFSTPFNNAASTWKTFIIELKLDWLWLRNLRPTNHGIDKKIGLSDHWPLWVTVALRDEHEAKK
ncbi:MAG TPA: endonuclease/exonuclease/phosphatase family protein [Pyrinomonadaceae bacterium]|nr:endonuclease/exonuclease/phosphatase family protein [Pyrinomonadaceae bacterium]